MWSMARVLWQCIEYYYVYNIYRLRELSIQRCGKSMSTEELRYIRIHVQLKCGIFNTQYCVSCISVCVCVCVCVGGGFK